MWNSVALVASNNFLPKTEFVAFAIEHADKHRIDLATPELPTVGNFWVDGLLKDFRSTYPELCERTRAEKIEKLKNNALGLHDFGE